MLVLLFVVVLIVGFGWYLWQQYTSPAIKQESNQSLQLTEKQNLERPKNNTQSVLQARDSVSGEFIAPYVIHRDANIADVYVYQESSAPQKIFTFKEKISQTKFISVALLADSPGIELINYRQSKRFVIDYAGKEEQNYPLLQNKDTALMILGYELLHFPQAQKLIYSVRYASSDTKKAQAKLIIADVQGNPVDSIPLSGLPAGLDSVRVIGWSTDRTSVYVAKIGWEGFAYAGLWRVELQSKKVQPIEGIGAVALSDLQVVPWLDMAVGVVATEIACENCMGGKNIIAPSRLVQFDLKTGTQTVVLESKDTVLTNPVLTADGTRIFVTRLLSEKRSTVLQMQSDGTDIRRVTDNGKLVAVSEDGSRVLLLENDVYSWVHTRTGEEKIIFPSKDKNERVEFLACSYPLQYICHYTR